MVCKLANIKEEELEVDSLTTDAKPVKAAYSVYISLLYTPLCRVPA